MSALKATTEPHFGIRPTVPLVSISHVIFYDQEREEERSSTFKD